MRRTDEVSGYVDATPARVYAAFTDGAALERWLAPEGMTARVHHFDLRAGGTYRMVLSYREPDGRAGKAGGGEDHVEGRFVEVVPGVRVVQEVEFPSDDPGFAGTMRMTWAVAASGAGALVTFRADDVPPGISAADHETGLRSSLTNLARFLEQE